MPLLLLLSPKTVLLWLAVIREAVVLARLLGPEKARDSLREQCSNCSVNQPKGDQHGSRN